MGQNGTSGGAGTPQATDMYGRQGATPTAAPGTPAAGPTPTKPASSYPYSTPTAQYGSAAGYTQPPQDSASGAYGSRAYGPH
jgi:hypothetical protein